MPDAYNGEKIGHQLAQIHLVSTISAGDIDAAENQMRMLLRQRHHLRPAEDDDFIIRSWANGTELATNIAC